VIQNPLPIPGEAAGPARRAWFTRPELVIGIVLVALLAGGALAYYRRMTGPEWKGKILAKQAATQAKVIHGWLTTYAIEHGGVYPTGTNANEAYRELFKINIGADENQFYIIGDRYHKLARGGRPDGDTGQEPDYVQALEAGENAFAYVSGLVSSDSPRLPLIANGFTSQPGIWSNKDYEKGGVFLGKYGVVCRVDGSSAAVDLKDGEWMIKERFNGQEVNIFTPGLEDTNFTVVNPQ